MGSIAKVCSNWGDRFSSRVDIWGQRDGESVKDSMQVGSLAQSSILATQQHQHVTAWVSGSSLNLVWQETTGSWKHLQLMWWALWLCAHDVLQEGWPCFPEAWGSTTGVDCTLPISLQTKLCWQINQNSIMVAAQLLLQVQLMQLSHGLHTYHIPVRMLAAISLSMDFGRQTTHASSMFASPMFTQSQTGGQSWQQCWSMWRSWRKRSIYGRNRANGKTSCHWCIWKGTARLVNMDGREVACECSSSKVGPTVLRDGSLGEPVDMWLNCPPSIPPPLRYPSQMEVQWDSSGLGQRAHAWPPSNLQLLNPLVLILVMWLDKNWVVHKLTCAYLFP